jgi:2-oxoglutarate/2-oxoacid ferredoxin oxidoreductase subunit beta
MTEVPQLKKKDFVSDQEVRWCPGCGDYSILSSIQMAMTKLNRKKEDIVFISGIGCSSRFPYYMNTYGMHTIHGRSLAFASGLKSHNRNLSIWAITGDGDSLSIGGNHLIHCLRRNVDLNIILFNNEIYGLTKGQYSPTSKTGLVTKSSPYGSIDRSFTPAKLAIGAESTFVARTIDTDPKHMMETFAKAEAHRGTSLVEVFQNCVIFNNKVHDLYTNRATRDDYTIRLEHGQPMIFGKEKNKGLVLKDAKFEVVTLGENGITEADILVHDQTNENLALMLTGLKAPDFPVPIGVLRSIETCTYDNELEKQVDQVAQKKGKGDMTALLNSGETWVVK